ncbi:M3 family metallopeptidase [Cellulomonas marina]|uniref:Peptidyl-dipeptidase Dcp n=1 Tax=Cellulomonas marina TaxID=988821 RepID=A0A1I0ZQJ4_9CELL|nr:M3 family metallopeptidase [Cellulomonas marina]GIG28839.1 peptidyl-dipeptidase Dcp [Cellulomonas marina]SFB27817.1 peptidyl-dipeptidase Dcp [Cellulomonas marina]
MTDGTTAPEPADHSLTDRALDPSNPFAAPSVLPYGLPDFRAIRVEHVRPAALAGMAQQRAEVEALVTDPAAPTVENTLEALERSGRLLDRVLSVFFTLVSSHGTPDVEALQVELAPLLAAHHDAIELDPRLFARVDALRAQAAAGDLVLEPDTAWLLTRTHRRLVRAGAQLDDAQRAHLTELNTEISRHSTDFERTLQAATNAGALLLTDEAETAGMPAGALAAARQAAAGRGQEGWLVELVLPSQQPALAWLEDRSVRERLYRATVERGLGGEHDTRPHLLALARLRAERARLLGAEHHAAYVAQDATAGSAEAVAEMLARVTPPAVANGHREAAELQAALERDVPGATLEPWDWAFYAERVGADRGSVTDAQTRPYLELDRVLRDGVFAAAHRLYGLTVAERDDLVGYHPDVRVFEVRDADGTGVGLFLGDWFTRDTKKGGAWMNHLVHQSTLLDERPVVINNLNVPKPPPGEPVLLTWDEVITMFHEFGHALHGLFSSVRWPSQSGTNVPRDFVEYPSQVNEMWAWEPEVLRSFAVHHATGEPMPAEWVDTLLAARQDGEGYATTTYLSAALLDQAWHRLAPEEVPADVAEVEAFEAAALERAGLTVHAIPTRYRSTYFAHVFAGGYAAGYYSYIWSEVLDADTVEWFRENGGLRRENGDTFRARLLSRGHAQDPLASFRDLRGRDASIEPLLVRRGLTGAAA